MKIINNIILGICCGIGMASSIMLFGRVKFIPGIIVGLVTTVYVVIILLKIDKSNNYPYWKRDKNGKL